MNFEDACREFLKGCLNASTDRPQDCPECLDAFVEKIKKLALKSNQLRCIMCGKECEQKEIRLGMCGPIPCIEIPVCDKCLEGLKK